MSPLSRDSQVLLVHVAMSTNAALTRVWASEGDTRGAWRRTACAPTEGVSKGLREADTLLRTQQFTQTE